MADDPEQEAAATKIQAVQRAKQAKAEVDQMKQDKKEEDAAVKIQAIQRGNADRKEVESLKEAQVDAQKQEDAAVKLQAVQRGNTGRDKVEKMKTQQSAKEERAQDPSSKKLHNPDPGMMERVFKLFDKKGDRCIDEDRFIHVLKVMGDDLKDDECSVVYRAVNRSWKDDDNLGINYSDFVTWIECTVLGMAVYDALADQLK